MSLSRTITVLALEAESQMRDLSASQRRMLQVLKEAPQYLVRGNLAQWDADYHRAMSDDEDEAARNFRVIESIFEIAAVNLYGAYQAGETKRVYDSVVSELQKLGIRVPPDLPVAAW
jgi:hypothetical protein